MPDLALLGCQALIPPLTHISLWFKAACLLSVLLRRLIKCEFEPTPDSSDTGCVPRRETPGCTPSLAAL